MANPIRTARGKRNKRKSRPTGPYYPVDDSWRAKVRERLRESGMSQAELARKIGASPGSIVLIFKPSTIQSRLVSAIHEALHLAPPATTQAIAA